MSNFTPFIEHIKDRLNKFGLYPASDTPIKNAVHLIVFDNAVNNTKFVILARKNLAAEPETFWGGVIDQILIKAIAKNVFQDKVPVSGLIVPNSEVDAVYGQFQNKGVRGNVYKLFDGYSLVALSKKDTRQLLAKKIKSIKDKKELPPKTQIPQPQIKQSNKIKRAAAAVLLLLFSLGIYNIIKNKDLFVPTKKAAVKKILNNAVYGTQGDPEILSAIAENSNLSQYEMYDLARKGYKANIAKNPNLQPFTMQNLASSPDASVRAALALNPSLPADLAERLAEDPSALVRANVSGHSGLSDATIAKLALDKDYAVRTGILKNDKINDKLLDLVVPSINLASCEVKENMYARKNISRQELSYNADNPDPCIRRGVAKNLSAPADLIDVLARDKDTSVRALALANPNLSIEKLNEMNNELLGGNRQTGVDAPTEELMRALLSNPLQKKSSLPPQILKSRLYESTSIQNKSMSGEDIRTLLHASYNKGGLNKFIQQINEIPKDKQFIEELVRTGATTGQDWQDKLRKKVNRAFADNLFDPVSTAGMLNSSPLYQGNKDIKLLSLYEVGDEGEFFSDKEIDAAMVSNINSFEEYFDANQLDKITKEMVKTADSIVEDAMNELIPAVSQEIKKAGRIKGDVTTFILKDLSPVLDEDFYLNSATKIEKLASEL